METTKTLRWSRGGATRACLVAASIVAMAQAVVNAQQIAQSGWRPFVIAVEPVIGPNGAVGGVAIDANGVLDRAEIDVSPRLVAERRRALEPVTADLNRASPLRKVSLRRLESLIAEHQKKEKPLPQSALYLAGLQRVTHVLVLPEENDIVIAGVADGWLVNDGGEVVGATSGLPVLHLDDLVMAIRAAAAAGRGDGLTCSIDPTEAGLARYQRLVSSRNLQMSPATIELLEQTLGPSDITITGVDPATHFAHTMVAADFRMKRLAMGFEAAPIEGLPSYLELLAAGKRTPRDAVLRFWLAPAYDRVLRDPAGLAWEFTGPGVKALTEDELLTADQGLGGSGRANPVAAQWAANFSKRFEELAQRIAVFGELRNCIDLAIVGAILTSQRCGERANYELPLWSDAKQVAVRKFDVAATTPSRASVVNRGSQWIVSVSGGVDLDSWSVVEKAVESRDLVAKRQQARPPANVAGWWWD